jgi:BirA family biotin operon repressor/biotin-[acetyl-CoA-carboxylase] ligase
MDSTNTFMKNRSGDEVSHGQLCITDFQRAGRGQHKKNWESKPGENLIFTLAFTPSSAARFPVLTLACARAIVAQIEEATEQKAFIKWPNDIYIHHKKVAGILTESVFNGNSLDRLVIGIGINVNQLQFSDELQAKVTSLQQAGGSEINREKFLAELLLRVEYGYALWLKRSDKQIKSINQKMIGYGEWVDLYVNENILDDKFKFLGINQLGRLTGISKEGNLKAFSHEQIRVIAN